MMSFLLRLNPGPVQTYLKILRNHPETNECDKTVKLIKLFFANFKTESNTFF